jgi:hypothetical protein
MSTKNQTAAGCCSSNSYADLLANAYVVEVYNKLKLWKKRAAFAKDSRPAAGRSTRRTADICAGRCFEVMAAAEEVFWNIRHATPAANLIKAIGRLQVSERNAAAAYTRLQHTMSLAVVGIPA